MINIMIVSPAFLPYMGVGSLRMASLSNHLQLKSMKVTILKNPDSYWPDSSLKGSRIHKYTVIDVDVKTSDSFNTQLLKYRQNIEKLVNDVHFDLIIYSTGPFYGVFLGPYLKKKYKIPYILEQRDLWLFHTSSKTNILGNIKTFLYSLLHYKDELKSVHYSSYYITVNNSLRKKLVFRYPLYSKKIKVVKNGYFIPKINYNSLNLSDMFIITNYGKLTYYNESDAAKLLLGIKRFLSETSNTVFIQIGEVEDKLLKLLNTIQFPKDKIIFKGYVSYDQGFSILKQSNILTICDTHDRFGYAQKMFDYIGANKPIIAIVHEKSEMAKVLNGFNGAFVCVDEIKVYETIKKIQKNKLELLTDQDTKLYSREYANITYENLIKKTLKKG